MRTAEEATADSTSGAGLREVMLATAAVVFGERLTELKVTAEEDTPCVPAEVSTAAMTEDKVDGLAAAPSPGFAEIWTIADVELALSPTLIRLRLLEISVKFRVCGRVLGIAATEVVRESTIAAVLDPIVWIPVGSPLKMVEVASSLEASCVVTGKSEDEA